MLTAAIVSTKLETGNRLGVCLQQTGLVASVRQWPLSSANAAKPGEVIPDVVILDLSHDAEFRLGLTARLREMRPNVLIIAWSPSQQPSAELVLQAMRSGVQDFLSPDLDLAALKGILARAIRQAETGEKGKARESKITVVMGVKGGAGTTTVAVNLGVQLASLTQKRVTLLDFARPLGHVSLFLDLQPQFSIRDSVENLERLDEHLFSGLLIRHKSGLGILAGTSHPDDWQLLPAPSLARVVSVAQSSSDFVVVDLSGVLWPAWSSVLSLANTLILVGEADAANMRNLERYLPAMNSLGVEAHRLHVVINRWQRRNEEMLKAFQENTGCSILARLPNDFRQVSEAITGGLPLSKNHGDPLGTEFRKLARQLAGMTPPVEQKHQTSNGTPSPWQGGLLQWLHGPLRH